MLIASRLQSLNLMLAGIINIRHFFADILHLGRGDTTNRTQARYGRQSLWGTGAFPKAKEASETLERLDSYITRVQLVLTIADITDMRKT